jgi:hypothetical protein
MSIGKAFERPNTFLFLATFTDSFVGQQIIKAAVSPLPYPSCCAVGQSVTLLPSLSFGFLGSEARYLEVLVPCSLHLNSQREVPILPNPLNDPEALGQTPALLARVTVLLALKGLTSCRSYKPGRRKSSNYA